MEEYSTLRVVVMVSIGGGLGIAWIIFSEYQPRITRWLKRTFMK